MQLKIKEFLESVNSENSPASSDSLLLRSYALFCESLLLLKLLEDKQKGSVNCGMMFRATCAHNDQIPQFMTDLSTAISAIPD